MQFSIQYTIDLQFLCFSIQQQQVMFQHLIAKDNPQVTAHQNDGPNHKIPKKLHDREKMAMALFGKEQVPSHVHAHHGSNQHSLLECAKAPNHTTGFKYPSFINNWCRSSLESPAKFVETIFTADREYCSKTLHLELKLLVVIVDSHWQGLFHMSYVASSMLAES
jgi:hypothetical protein